MWCRILGFHTSTSLYLGVATLSLPFSSCAHINGFSGSRRATCHIRAQSVSLSGSSHRRRCRRTRTFSDSGLQQSRQQRQSAAQTEFARAEQTELSAVAVCAISCWLGVGVGVRAYHSEEALFLVCAAVDRRVVSSVWADGCLQSHLIDHTQLAWTAHTNTHAHTPGNRRDVQPSRTSPLITQSSSISTNKKKRGREVSSRSHAQAHATHATAGVVCVCGLWRVLLSGPVLALSVPTSVASAESESNCPFPARTHTSKSRIATWTVYTYIMYQVYKVTRAFFVWIA